MTPQAKSWFERMGLVRSNAPTARQFLQAEGTSCDRLRSLSQAMDFAERYADFVAEFERREGVLSNVDRWPCNKPERKF